MSSSEAIGVERHSGVALVTLNRPDSLNALTIDMMQRFRDAMDDIGSDTKIRAVLLTGAGRGFCAGADLSALASNDDADDAMTIADCLREFINPALLAIAAMPKPVIAAVNGAAAGAGCGIALMADIVVAARSARFIQSFANIGASPDAGSSWILPRILGPNRATAMMMLAEPVDAETACRWGMVHKIYDDADLLTEATAMAERMARGPAESYAAIKQLVRAKIATDLAAQLALEADRQEAIFETPDLREGIAAFVARRPPVFGAS